jgi:AcrR family transcriptional regulator
MIVAVTSKPTRRPRNSLTPEAIVAAAFTVTERSGGAGLTFGAIGAELGAHPTALYRHFRDKDELMLGLVDALHAEVLAELGPPLPDWRAELESLAARTHAVFLRHPAIAQHAAVRTARREHEFALVDRLLGALRRTGLADAEVALYYRVLGDAVLSYSAMDAALEALDPEVRAADLRAWKVEYQAQDPARHPHLAAYSHLFPALDDPANYATLIELLLDAVELRARRVRAARTGPENELTPESTLSRD